MLYFISTLEKSLYESGIASYFESSFKKYNNNLNREIKNINNLCKKLTKQFVYQVLSSVHLKIYDFSATEEQVKRKHNFKKKFVNYYKHKLEKEIRQ